MDRGRNWLKYEKVRRSGKYNMLTDMVRASKEAGLSIEEYKDVIRNYDEYKKLAESWRKQMKNKYSIYYDHIDYTMEEWEMPADIKIDPKLGLENYEAIEWGIKHGIFDLIPISGYNEDGQPLDEDGEPFDDRCLEASLFTDDSEFAEYMIPFYEFEIMEAGKSPYVHRLEELINNKPAFRKEAE